MNTDFVEKKSEKKNNKSKINTNNLNKHYTWLKKNKEEKPKPIVNIKKKYVFTNYGNWLDIRKYDEMAIYYRKKEDTDKDEKFNINSRKKKPPLLKIYTILFINAFYKYFYL